MALADELIRLEQLHARGALTSEEFARAKARVLESGLAGGGGAGQSPAVQAINRLRRSRTDRWLGGVCDAFKLESAHARIRAPQRERYDRDVVDTLGLDDRLEYA